MELTHSSVKGDTRYKGTVCLKEKYIEGIEGREREGPNFNSGQISKGAELLN